MGILTLAFLGVGLGSVLMDITETIVEERDITSGANIVLVGR